MPCKCAPLSTRTSNLTSCFAEDTRAFSLRRSRTAYTHLPYSGLQLLTQIIIADITTLKWRGLVSSLTSAPFIINAFIGSMVATSMLENSTWRWGCKCRTPSSRSAT